ncbi:putative transmembrane protein [Toxoplasma gondii GAB2-2007-GAL-DOM2]|uniref:Transmembrane protein n=9 Tax=Toxoplasma gondii TaxID=5811 RepID=A0A125YQ60_TOXGV|nr:hypothetical protein TGGT1_227275 [Toxoplasma gondii GT1]ESS32691.1 putative transmembrane protein [Toxoplasma gondii VEG]KAF4640752.1 hypothetical protein TGRH88_046780 [Toxoplasma gondii]KFG42391.1 putative transmembrane protein [Toxoplasma gondii p89]KFG45190.1 putative transmembrane protein [Toxoplasma gondii GAB2-2007-GAL-DOM2]KFG51964.1 putative transmembrane protein [Toxoplasma gondii FOU]KFH09961.1 putative transmembrane protein [Toxoplasma gondii MAS]PUA91038.1 putative transmemb
MGCWPEHIHRRKLGCSCTSKVEAQSLLQDLFVLHQRPLLHDLRPNPKSPSGADITDGPVLPWCAAFALAVTLAFASILNLRWLKGSTGARLRRFALRECLASVELPRQTRCFCQRACGNPFPNGHFWQQLTLRRSSANKPGIRFRLWLNS